MPSAVTKYGPIERISQSAEKVNTSDKSSSDSGKRFSIDEESFESPTIGNVAKSRFDEPKPKMKDGHCLCRKRQTSLSKLVDFLLESLDTGIYFSKAYKNFIDACVVVGADLYNIVLSLIR